MHGMRAGVHSTLGSSPGNLVFNRDMFLNIHLIANWHATTQKREHLIHEKLMRGKPEKKWLQLRSTANRTSGLYKIVQFHVNGAVTIQLRPGLTEIINIRQIIPYKQ
jgi:hypothetical protein